jgi:cation:H+ antiporter
MLVQVSLLILSLVMLYFGADFVLDAAEKIGRYLGLSPLVIGLILIGFGTSLPEFFVSQLASFGGSPEIALGNIVGSNIANLFLILGVAGVINKLNIQRKDIERQIYFHIAVTGLLIGSVMYGHVDLALSAVYIVFFSLYLFDTFRQMEIQKATEEKVETQRVAIAPITYGKLLIGFGLLFGGGEVLVGSGSNLAALLGVPQYIVAAILVAVGTSFPELITSILTAVKGKDTDIIVGNIIGSNAFNVAFVLGSLGPYNFPFGLTFRAELLMLTMASFFLLALYKLKKNFGRISGVYFLSMYGVMVFLWVSGKNI